MPKINLVAAAVRMLGSEGNLAEACNVTQPTINTAIKTYEETGNISAELAAAIHRATNGAVPNYLMRDDLWDLPVLGEPKKRGRGAPPRGRRDAASSPQVAA